MSRRKDREDLLNLSLMIFILRRAWGKGDDHEIQLALEDLFSWQDERDDRLTAENLRRKAA